MSAGDIWRGAAAGAIGGAAGASAMVVFNHLLARTGFARGDLGRHHQEHRVEAKPNDSDATIPDEPATRKAAGWIAGPQWKDMGGPIVHHLFGACTGAIYGALAARLPAVTAGAGTPYGALLWLTAAEAGLPLAGLSRKPTAYPVERHAAALASHLAFGATLEIVRRGLTRRSS
ncbi:MAG TPA: DUF1440 domain-containing protein [Vicinamibacterales bacterium]|nr:DUF1440 domain-containing protein [Vicinamibacterales bacterium]